jgi:hypothetical protein
MANLPGVNIQHTATLLIGGAASEQIHQKSTAPKSRAHVRTR